MSIDDEISALEMRRDKCLADIDSRVVQIVDQTRSALSITRLVQRFPFAAVGAALSAGLLASRSPRKIFGFTAHMVRLAIAAGRQRKEPPPPKAERPPARDAVPKSETSTAGKFWQNAIPLVEVAAPIILERLPWAKIRHSIQSRTHRPADGVRHPPTDDSE